MRKWLAVAVAVFAASVFLSGSLSAGIPKEISTRVHTYAATDKKRPATAATVDIIVVVRSEGEYGLCKGPYKVKLAYVAMPLSSKDFEESGASLNDLYFEAWSFDLQDALEDNGQPKYFPLGKPGTLEFRVEPPANAVLSEATLEIFSRKDAVGLSSAFVIPFCEAKKAH